MRCRLLLCVVVALFGALVAADADCCEDAISFNLPFTYEGSLLADMQSYSACSGYVTAEWLTFGGIGDWVVVELYDSNFDYVIEIVEGDCDETYDMYCYDSSDTISAGQSYSYVYYAYYGDEFHILLRNADSSSPSHLAYTLEVYQWGHHSESFSGNVCGNWVAEEPEECDSGTGCDWDCTCMDGYVPKNPPQWDCQLEGMDCFPSGWPVAVEWSPYLYWGSMYEPPSINSACSYFSTVGHTFYYYAWYTEEIKVSTCSWYTTFDTVVEVWSGDCDNGFYCVNYNDDTWEDECPNASELTFWAYSGTYYYILVYPASDPQYDQYYGEYELSIGEEADVCPIAQWLDPFETTSGQITWMNYLDYGCWNTLLGHWYEFYPDFDGKVTIYICELGSFEQVTLYVITGLCDSYTEDNCYRLAYADEAHMCHDGNGVSMTIDVYEYQYYYILVGSDYAPITYSITYFYHVPDSVKVGLIVGSVLLLLLAIGCCICCCLLACFLWRRHKVTAFRRLQEMPQTVQVQQLPSQTMGLPTAVPGQPYVYYAYANNVPGMPPVTMQQPSTAAVSINGDAAATATTTSVTAVPPLYPMEHQQQQQQSQQQQQAAEQPVVQDVPPTQQQQLL